MTEHTIKAHWIVDAAYLLMALKGKGNFDYLLLRKFLEKHCGVEISQAHYFNSTDKSNEAQNKFHNWLRKPPPAGPGFITRLYGYKENSIKCPHCEQFFQRQYQKGVDIGIAKQMFASVPRIPERIILCAGDGDFAEVCQRLYDLGTTFDVVGTKDTMSLELAQYGRVVYLDDDEIWSQIDKANASPFKPQGGQQC